jgi:hypothetical protein
MQERNDLTQDEVMTLEKFGFFVSDKLKFHPRNLFGDNAFVHFNKQTNVL